MKKNKKRASLELKRYEQQYERLKRRVASLGYVVQGSITKRNMVCGNSACRCHTDPRYRHGPYFQLSWKEAGKTTSVYLSEQQVLLCEEWIANNKELEEIIRQMRNISREVARLK